MASITRLFNTEKYPKINHDEILRLIKSMNFVVVETDELKNTEFICAINQSFIIDNAVVVKFKSEDSNNFSRCIHWIGIGNTGIETVSVNSFFTSIFANPTINKMQSMQKLLKSYENYDYPLGNNIIDIEFVPLSPFTIDGELAEILHNGGAYTSNKFLSKDSKIMASLFVEHLMNYRYSDFKVFALSRAWSEWFCGLAWDYTYFFLDELMSEITILAITDND